MHHFGVFGPMIVLHSPCAGPQGVLKNLSGNINSIVKLKLESPMSKQIFKLMASRNDLLLLLSNFYYLHTPMHKKKNKKKHISTECVHMDKGTQM